MQGKVGVSQFFTLRPSLQVTKPSAAIARRGVKRAAAGEEDAVRERAPAHHQHRQEGEGAARRKNAPVARSTKVYCADH